MIEEQQDCRLMLVSWDMYGLESIVDVTEKQKSLLFDIVASGKNSFDSWLYHTVQHMSLRARTNSHRQYEVYSIKFTPEITEDDVVKLFQTNPQYIADLIRQNGIEIFSSRSEKQNQVIF